MVSYRHVDLSWRQDVQLYDNNLYDGRRNSENQNLESAIE